MTLDVLKERGTPLEKQERDWHDLVRVPFSKLDDDAFTRVRVILMNGIESEALRFSHSAARMNPPPLQQALAVVRRSEQHQQTMVNWLNPPDQDPLETTLGFEQVAIEITANVAQNEPDPYLKDVYDFGLLEDFDHLYRYSALYDRLYGRDPNVILQSYTDIIPGRPTVVEHRAPNDDLRRPYDRRNAAPITKINATTIMAAEHQTHDYYMTIGPMFSDPTARQLYAEIASIEEQHVTQYESISDPSETWIEKWLIHEMTEVYNYWGCYMSESNPRIRQIWERFLSWELGHLHAVMDVMRKYERRDPEALIPATLAPPIAFESQREYVRDTLQRTVDCRANGVALVPKEEESRESIEFRKMLNASGSPSETIAAGYQWRPGGELTEMPPAALLGSAKMKLPIEAAVEAPYNSNGGRSKRVGTSKRKTAPKAKVKAKNGNGRRKEARR